MNQVINFKHRRSDDRGHFDHGWLKTYHTFSFSDYDDPEHRGFSDLLVINDDYVAPNKGFGMHPHRDMEIFTYILSGELQHKDSMGNGATIRPGDVQMMSAGTGILHSEFNPSLDTPVHLLQIWIQPNKLSVEPRYGQTHVTPAEKRGKLHCIISNTPQENVCHVYQDISVYAGLLDGDESFSYTIAPGRKGYIHLATGQLKVNGEQLNAGDGLYIYNQSELVFTNGQNNAEVLLFDLR
jgi:quercetin 2,3-dioxygenase